MADTKTKKTVVKKEVAVKKPAIKKEKVVTTATLSVKTDQKKPATGKTGDSLQATVYSVNGKKSSTMTMPKKIFGAKVNEQLLALAVRVYLANQRQGTQSTKSRGEVRGSTRKIYRQKGTGRARHGGIRAPIFVHGGVAHGPNPRDFSLKLPVKMKRAALYSALSAKFHDGEIIIVDGITEMEPKTKAMYGMMKQLGLVGEKMHVLVVLAGDNAAVYRSMRNIDHVSITASNRLNTYNVLNNTKLLLSKEAVSAIEKTFAKENHV